MTNSINIPPAPATKRSRAMDQARRRTSRWRSKAMAEGRPSARAAAEAVVEALSLLLAREGKAEQVGTAELVRVAALCLQRDGYSRKPALTVITRRIKPRSHHADPNAVPNVHGIDDPNAVPPPKRGREWRPADFETLNAIVRS